MSEKNKGLVLGDEHQINFQFRKQKQPIGDILFIGNIFLAEYNMSLQIKLLENSHILEFNFTIKEKILHPLNIKILILDDSHITLRKENIKELVFGDSKHNYKMFLAVNPDFQYKFDGYRCDHQEQVQFTIKVLSISNVNEEKNENKPHHNEYKQTSPKPSKPKISIEKDDEKQSKISIKKDDEKQSKISTKKENIFINNSIEKELFTMKGQISEGATSITYKIIDKRTNVPICKKVLKHKEGVIPFEVAKRTMCEFEVMHKITHPCICKAYYFNIADVLEIKNKKGENEKINTISLFLEYLEHSLNEVLQMKINNTLKTRIVIDISHAMNFLHKNGLMHRDLKVENIMFNSLFETKLVDFGLVRINETYFDGYSFVEDSLTRGVGTLAYMSPQMANEEDYDNKTDVYSFGILLHVIFTGKLPKQSLKDKLNGKKIDLPAPSSSISQFCIDLISKCLSYKPSDRPSFEQILQLMRQNLYALADDVDPSILEKRDNELNLIELNK